MNHTQADLFLWLKNWKLEKINSSSSNTPFCPRTRPFSNHKTESYAIYSLWHTSEGYRPNVTAEYYEFSLFAVISILFPKLKLGSGLSKCDFVLISQINLKTCVLVSIVPLSSFGFAWIRRGVSKLWDALFDRVDSLPGDLRYAHRSFQTLEFLPVRLSHMYHKSWAYWCSTPVYKALSPSHGWTQHIIKTCTNVPGPSSIQVAMHYFTRHAIVP